MNRDQRRQLAADTIEIIEDGYYEHPSTSERVNLDPLLEMCTQGTRYYGPELPGYSTIIEVTDETTLQAAQALAKEHTRVGVLNFASGKTPVADFFEARKRKRSHWPGAPSCTRASLKVAVPTTMTAIRLRRIRVTVTA